MEDSRDKSLLPYMNNVKNKINESDIITQTINEIINEEISINSEYDNKLDDTLLNEDEEELNDIIQTFEPRQGLNPKIWDEKKFLEKINKTN